MNLFYEKTKSFVYSFALFLNFFLRGWGWKVRDETGGGGGGGAGGGLSKWIFFYKESKSKLLLLLFFFLGGGGGGGGWLESVNFFY